jgi:hypothetical protein
MRGGTIIIASASIGGLAYAAFAFVRAGKAIDRAFELPFGDVVAVDREARGRGGRLRQPTAVGCRVRTHDGGGF